MEVVECTIEDARIAFALSFGSCSYDDPVNDLAALGLLCAVLVTAGPYWYLHGIGIDMTEVYAQQGGIDIGGVGMDPILRIGIFPD